MSSDFHLSEEQEQQVIDAIRGAEERTSGEIRVHIEATCQGEPLERAARVFHELGMDQTELQNGILIYIASVDHKVAVYAGKGIHRQVPEGFWNDVLDLLLEYFSSDRFEEGIARAVTMAGDKLRELYPRRGDDINELPDDISYRDNNNSEQ